MPLSPACASLLFALSGCGAGEPAFDAGTVERIACTSLGFDGCGEGATCGPLFPRDEGPR